MAYDGMQYGDKCLSHPWQTLFTSHRRAGDETWYWPPQTSNISWHSAPTDLQRLKEWCQALGTTRDSGEANGLSQEGPDLSSACATNSVPIGNEAWSNNRLVGVLSSHPHFDGKGIIIEWSVRKLGEWWHPRCFVILLLPLEYPGKRLNPRWSKQSIRVRFPWGMFLNRGVCTLLEKVGDSFCDSCYRSSSGNLC